MNGSIPDGAKRILRVLSDAGYGSYIVGGCVRDLLLGKAPHDWDICTSAKPDETIAALEGMHIVKTGLKHGTVTVILEDGSYEVTTFRVDGVYKDNRHPENVRVWIDLDRLFLLQLTNGALLKAFARCGAGCFLSSGFNPVVAGAFLENGNDRSSLRGSERVSVFG